MKNGPEYNQCQRPAWELLRDHLGYEYADGESAAFMATRESEAEPLLVDRLTRKLKEINPGLTEDGARQAIAALKQPLAAGLIDANETCYRLLSRWVTVEETVPGGREPRSVRFFDFDNPENNEFLVVEEFWMKGPRWRRRLDLVVFVNGIPVVAAECKDPADPHGMSKAVGDLLAYQKPDEGVVRLFHTVQLCVGLKRNDARYGAVCTPLNRYAVWKSYYPVTKQEWERRLAREPTEQDRLLVGMLAKATLLDLIRNFVVFDRQGGKLVKKVARYQQYEAVNEAIRRVTDPPAELAKAPLSDRGGIVWHTQGSGKSLSMLWLCMKLRRLKELENPTLLIVTDRRDLDRQIHETFKYCGFENPVRAKRVTHLRKLLNGATGQTVMATVQKFRDDVDISRGSRHPVLSNAENVFVLVDEAHRSEYGQFNAHLRRALPNACLMAFTGTPIRKTEAKFGSYIHKYTMPQSVEDGATVPILYESRLPELAVWGKRIDPLFKAAFGDLTEEQQRKLAQQEVTERKIAESAIDRMEMIAADIAKHFKENFEPDGFKAQVAACSQKAAGMYYEELSKYFPDQVALLISDPATKDSELWELKKPFEDEDAVIDQFKEEDVNKLAIIVVHNKYLTGFDAPIERVLYLDRSLGGPGTEHTLLQAIARVNRPLPEKDKQWGLVVDYWGVSAFLDKALAAFGDDLAPEQVLEKRDNESAFQTLKQRRADVFGMFDASFTRDDIEPWILSLEDEDRRAIFQSRYRAFYKALEQLLPDPRALNYLGDFAWLRRLRREMLAHFSTEDLELPDCSAKVRDLINRHVRGEEVRVLLEPIPIMSEEFTREVAKLQSPRAKASRMEHAISRTITVKLHEDPAFYESVKERLERIINERREQRIDDAEEFKLLIGLREELAEGQDRETESLGLSGDAAPFFGILKRGLADDGELEAAALASLADDVLGSLREQAVIDWQNKEDVQRDMRRAVKRQLRLAGCPIDTIDPLTVQIMDLARVRLT
jgi:type I restriction enzyme R subunit